MPADSDASLRPALPGMDQARDTLHRIWGHTGFRGLQASVVAEVLAGRDVLAVLPTGGEIGRAHV